MLTGSGSSSNPKVLPFGWFVYEAVKGERPFPLVVTKHLLHRLSANETSAHIVRAAPRSSDGRMAPKCRPARTHQRAQRREIPCYYKDFSSAPGATRTPNLLIRRQNQARSPSSARCRLMPSWRGLTRNFGSAGTTRHPPTRHECIHSTYIDNQEAPGRSGPGTDDLPAYISIVVPSWSCPQPSEPTATTPERPPPPSHRAPILAAPTGHLGMGGAETGSSVPRSVVNVAIQRRSWR